MPSPCDPVGPGPRRFAATTIAWLAVTAACLLVGTPRASAAPSWTALHFAIGAGFQHTLAVGDLNGDGKLDVATPNSVSSAVTVLLGNGDGTLAMYHAYPVFGDPQDVQMADLTGDGNLDLATPDYDGSGVTVLRGLGDGTFAPRVAYPVGAGLVSLATADLDGDTRLELVVSKESGDKVAVLPSLAGGGFGPAVEVASGATPHQIATTMSPSRASGPGWCRCTSAMAPTRSAPARRSRAARRRSGSRSRT